MFQTKEQAKNSVKGLNDKWTKIGNQHDKVIKVMVIKMLTEFEREMNKTVEISTKKKYNKVLIRAKEYYKLKWKIYKGITED